MQAGTLALPPAPALALDQAGVRDGRHLKDRRAPPYPVLSRVTVLHLHPIGTDTAQKAIAPQVRDLFLFPVRTI